VSELGRLPCLAGAAERLLQHLPGDGGVDAERDSGLHREGHHGQRSICGLGDLVGVVWAADAISAGEINAALAKMLMQVMMRQSW
jgi:hypothetical protein